MTSAPPFKAGDILCLEGPGVSRGCAIHVAGEPVLIEGQWCNGNRPWGVKYMLTLRHATPDDASRVLSLVEKDLDRLKSERSRIREMLCQLQKQEAPNVRTKNSITAD
jgi:hypothetical protein